MEVTTSTGPLTAIEMAAVNIVFIVLLTLFQNQGNTVTKGDTSL